MTDRVWQEPDNGLDHAVARFGGKRSEWLDLSTGINPVPYPAPQLPADTWTALPDQAAIARLVGYARRFWSVPESAVILPTAGTAPIIAALPHLRPAADVSIAPPTYSEHAAAFRTAGWTVSATGPDAIVAMHPNMPDGRAWAADQLEAPFTIIDETYCDVAPQASLIHLAARADTIVIKSFGEFWGLGGLRLGFAIGDPAIIADLDARIGPWTVSGPALAIGAEALADPDWADETRVRLDRDAERLDAIMAQQGAPVVGGTALFRLYEVADAQAAKDHFASHKIWSRTFPDAPNWLRLGLPAPDKWAVFDAVF